MMIPHHGFLCPSLRTGLACFHASGSLSGTYYGSFSFWAIIAWLIRPCSGLVCLFDLFLTAFLCHVAGFPSLRLLRRLRPLHSIGRKLTYSVQESCTRFPSSHK